VQTKTAMLKAELWTCGDICCCAHMDIWLIQSEMHIKKIWESIWFSFDGLEPQELEELKEIFVEACSKFGIKADVSGDGVFDWNGERKLGLIYTIGRTESYESYFREQQNPQKLGREHDYAGGSVWKTKEDAQASCPEGCSVYGVLADWDTETVKGEGDNFHDLLVTSLLVKIDNE